MNAERHHPHLEAGEGLHRNAHEQLRAMRDGDWETVFRVADAREALFEQFDGAATSPLSASERDRLAHVLIELGELDAQITRGTLKRLREVKAELDACDDGLGVVSGYQWANNTGVQKMIDCYG